MKDNNLKDTRIKSNNKDYNLKRILLKQGKIDNSFLEKIKLLTLEDIQSFIDVLVYQNGIPMDRIMKFTREGSNMTPLMICCGRRHYIELVKQILENISLQNL